MSDVIPKDAHAMIIGAMKCGTSSLYHYLRGHPEICPGIVKEPEFFSENQGHGWHAENYDDLFSFDSRIHKYTLDGSTGYTKFPTEPNVAKSIFEYGILPKFIYIVRDPFDRIQSQFNFWHINKDRLDIVDDKLVCLSNYYLQLEQYRRYFPISRILVLDFDDLKRNPPGVLESVYNHLNLPNNYFPDNYEVKNKSKQPMSIIERNIKKFPISQFLISSFPKRPKEFLKVILRRTFPGRKRELTEAERNYIYNRLREGMYGLNEIYGVDVSKWGFSG